MKFAVKLTETLTRTVIVEADDYLEAEAIVEDAYYYKGLELHADNSAVNLELENDTENYIEIFGKEEFEAMNVSEEIPQPQKSCNTVNVEIELNRAWIFDDQDETIGETNFIIPGEWLSRIYKIYFSTEYSTFEDFLEQYIPEEEGKIIYEKAIEDKVLIKDLGIVMH